ncbi:transglutaminase-like cysteine peptidase [Paragemmobacter ruber]|uniref:transglutaminase-like cysteine peptidase n=1 Tax=Paragemmobacter ruber TaxID=1985673 RepID=UPI002E2B4026|nr:transglutaminase-like cysteine peptidase [Rhodobacter ruber]
MLATGAPSAASEGGVPPFLPAKQTAPAPDGAAKLCQTYPWACAGKLAANATEGALLDVAADINRKANATIPAISDQAQYGRAEHWSLPGDLGGDCEDYVLYKKQALIAAGVPARSLLIAVVLDRRDSPHAVLILRTEAGDYVLDNVTDRILPWARTGYTFISMQNPDNPARWVMVFEQAPRRLAAGIGLQTGNVTTAMD